MIKRDLESHLVEVAKQLPVIAILGPRQSGKTTIARKTFPHHRYITLEELDVRTQAHKDPREFLAFNKNEYGLILDEIQHAPELLSYIQTIVDEEKLYGYFILTGSQNFLVGNTISQTLAGRMAVLTLLPLSIHELYRADLLPENVEYSIYKGSYPRLYDDKVSPAIWYPSYILNYIERDVRQVAHVGDARQFYLFLKLLAGRIGQLLNVSSLATDAGISYHTARSWISLLEASYIIFMLEPHYKNFSKRLIKSPKLFFFDTGLACSLLGIESPEQMQTHYLRGGLFENLIIGDFYKQYYNAARQPHLYFWRDNHGDEVDCIIERADMLYPVEIKAGRTVSDNYFSGLLRWNDISGTNPKDNMVVFAGSKGQKGSAGRVYTWKEAGELVDVLK